LPALTKERAATETIKIGAKKRRKIKIYLSLSNLVPKVIYITPGGANTKKMALEQCYT